MRLDQLCSAIVDCEHKTAPITPGGRYFAVGTPAMQGNVIGFESAREISESTYRKWTQRMAPEKGDLLFAREAPVGPIVAIPSTLNVAPGQRTVLLRPNPVNVDSTYLYYAIAAPSTQRRISDLSMGSTVAHLNVADVRALELDVPPLPEQQAIAEVLGALDDKIAANSQLASTAEQLMLAITQPLPRSAVLGAVARLSKRQMSVDDMAGRDLFHYSLPAFDAGQLPMREAGASIKSGKCTVDAPCVLLSKLNPRIPRAWNVPAPEDDSVASTEFLVLEPTELPTAALWASVAGDGAAAFLQEHAAGTSGSHQRVRPDDALAMPVPALTDFPPTLLDQLSSLGDLVVATRTESQTLAALRDTLLPALMDGTVRVRDAIASTERAAMTIRNVPSFG